MKRKLTLTMISLSALLHASVSYGQAFTSGSTGADGPLNATGNSVVIPLPANGVLNYTTIRIARGTTVTFVRNALNTPVHMLAQGDVVIEGVIDVSGEGGNNINGGDGGPGGFDGGKPGILLEPPGAGYGPGAGKGGTGTGEPDGAGGGAFATTSVNGSQLNHGAPYGSPLLMPLVGGSGGGGTTGTATSYGVGGGGGGGAILVASSTRIDFGDSSGIRANGGQSGWGYGSGGAIRLVAPIVTGRGQHLTATGRGYGGDGRIRIDTINRREFLISSSPQFSLGSFMAVFPPVTPRLEIIEAAGTAIPEGTSSRVTVQLPFGADSARTIKVQARDFKASVPIEVVLTPDSGVPVTYKATIDNTAGTPAVATVPVTVPANVLVTVQAWAR